MSGFEDLERAANRAIFDALANCEAVVNGAQRVRGIFRREPSVAFGMTDATAPELAVLLEDWPQPARDDQVQIEDGIYAGLYGVKGIAPDGNGAVALSLALS